MSSASICVNTDAAGKAQVNYTLGNRAGAGNNVVEAYSTKAKGVATFTASATPQMAAMVNVDSGNNQFGAIGQPLVLPFVAVVTDPGYNRLGGIPVTFTARQGGGTFAGGNVDINMVSTQSLEGHPRDGAGVHVVHGGVRQVRTEAVLPFGQPFGVDGGRVVTAGSLHQGNFA